MKGVKPHPCHVLVVTLEQERLRASPDATSTFALLQRPHHLCGMTGPFLPPHKELLLQSRCVRAGPGAMPMEHNITEATDPNSSLAARTRHLALEHCPEKPVSVGSMGPVGPAPIMH